MRFSTTQRAVTEKTKADSFQRCAGKEQKAILTVHKGKNLHHESGQSLQQGPGEAAQTPSVEIFKTKQDKALNL